MTEMNLTGYEASTASSLVRIIDAALPEWERTETGPGMWVWRYEDQDNDRGQVVVVNALADRILVPTHIWPAKVGPTVLAGEPTVLKFRSASGRTEIAWKPDGSVSLHVLTGGDVLTGAELIDAARALDKGQDAAYAAGISEGLRQATEALRPSLSVLAYVSRGRRFVDVEPYPDAAARRALGALDDAGLVGPWEPAEQHQHCDHWQEGDGDCCDCKAPNWCPEEGVTPENEQALRAAWEADSGARGTWEPAEQPEPARCCDLHGRNLRQATEDARSGYDAAIATLTDVADRTGSESARYWAGYLTVDPDRRAPAAVLVGPWEPAEQPTVVEHAFGCMCGTNDAGQRFNDPICRRTS